MSEHSHSFSSLFFNERRPLVLSNFIVQPSKFCTVPGSFIPGGFKNQMGKFCWVVRFVPGGGHWTYAPMTPPWYKTNNQAKFAPKITKQNLLGWTMKLLLGRTSMSTSLVVVCHEEPESNRRTVRVLAAVLLSSIK